MKKYYLIIFLFFLFFLVIFLNGCVKNEIEWQKENGKWTAVNDTCLRQNPIKYLCEANCYEKTYLEIWNFCRDKGKMKRTNTGIEVLCFEGSCIPEIKNQSCVLTCPI